MQRAAEISSRARSGVHLAELHGAERPSSQARRRSGSSGAEREERVRSALGFLPREQAEILKMSFFGEETQSQIASAFGIPLGTVKSRVRLALGRLRQILAALK